MSLVLTQVNQCEDQLRQLEISSQQLLQASDEQVNTATPILALETFSSRLNALCIFMSLTRARSQVILHHLSSAALSKLQLAELDIVLFCIACTAYLEKDSLKCMPGQKR